MRVFAIEDKIFKTQPLFVFDCSYNELKNI